MDKKLTTTLGIALGASLLAGAGFSIYKYFSKKSSTPPGDGSANNSATSNLFGSFIGNGLTKSSSLYGGNQADNELVGGGLYKSNSLLLTA